MKLFLFLTCVVAVSAYINDLTPCVVDSTCGQCLNSTCFYPHRPQCNDNLAVECFRDTDCAVCTDGFCDYIPPQQEITLLFCDNIEVFCPIGERCLNGICQTTTLRGTACNGKVIGGVQRPPPCGASAYCCSFGPTTPTSYYQCVPCTAFPALLCPLSCGPIPIFGIDGVCRSTTINGTQGECAE